MKKDKAIIPFEELGTCDLFVDYIYEGGKQKNAGDDPISKLLNVGVSGGFRISGKKPNYKLVVLYTSGEEVDWPDKLDPETGQFIYYGDNRISNSDVPYYKKKGNQFLEYIFEQINVPNNRVNVPPIFVFQKSPTENSSRAVKFLGLAIPGSTNDMGEQLAAIWRTQEGTRFQNYMAHFSMIYLEKAISREWINNIQSGNPEDNAPREWLIWEKRD
jgi:hypothetical protein